jgi:uncharacterized circularly permuted ATP-grasp superfamily protein
MLERLLAEFDERIVNDASLVPSVFDGLTASQRELGLLFGDRPTCPFLRPHFIARSQYDEVARAAQTIACAIEKLVKHALDDDELMCVLDLTERQVKMARFDPGYSSLCVSSRLDAYISDDGFKFLEYNAETPAGVADQMQLEKVLFQLAHVRQFLDRRPYWRPEPHRRLLSALIEAYREWGGEEERPQIAIVDWKGVATQSEFRILKDYFDAEGCPSIIADPRELVYDVDRLRAGSFRIDILYKRVIIHEFLDQCDDDHPLSRAYADGRVCMANSFRAKVAHKKAVFAILSDPKYEDLFTPEEIEIFRRHIPWTRCFKPAVNGFRGSDCDLIDLVSRKPERFVLKPNDDYGGHGVFLGWGTSREEWERAVALAQTKPYVVQERVASRKITMPIYDNEARLERMYVDFNPFLFQNEPEGALIRLSPSEMLNVSSGGGQTALLVIEGM